MYKPRFQWVVRPSKPTAGTLLAPSKQLVGFRMFVWLCIVVCASAGRFVTTKQVMTGQPHEVPVNSTKVLTAARFAVVEFNRANTEDQFAYKIMNITSAKIQVVAGLKYILDVRLGRTTCRTSDTTDSEPCVYHSDPKASSRVQVVQTTHQEKV